MTYAADARHSNSTLEQKLRHLYTLRGDGPSIDLTIRPDYLELLSRLGDPHRKLPPVIHVAGTNGKGSTIAAMRAVFEAAGYRAHVYTSPHLKRFNERIVLAGREIGDDDLENYLDEVTAAGRGLKLTFFEITTAMAFAAFARVPADILLLETGLGGRLDCTNVVERPLATVITVIGRDHSEYLGDTITQIAAEKAGIMKPGVPCVVAPQADPAAAGVFAWRAAELHCVMHSCGGSWRVEAVDGGMIFYWQDQKPLHLPLPSLAGPHQVDNAATALACLHAIADGGGGFEFPADAFARGMKNMRWPARLQCLQNAPVVLPPGWELWINGGHNENAARALAAQAALWRAQDGRKLHLVVGMMKSKDPAVFIAPLAPYAASVTALPVPGEPLLAHDAAALAAGLRAVRVSSSPEDALNGIVRSAPEPGRILVTGSLYLMRLFLQ